MRLNKFLARAGLGSRRGVETLIEEGRVSVNGNLVTSPGLQVDPDKDKVYLDDGRVRLAKKPPVYIVLNKPVGYLCTRFDPDERKLVYDLLPPKYRQLAHAGRLDINSRGLVVFSNDGEFIQKLTHPRGKITKYYRVRYQGGPYDWQRIRDRLIRGVRDDGELLKIEDLTDIGSNMVTIALSAGKNRHIRRMFARLRIGVRDLYRYGIGYLLQGDLLLPESGWVEIQPGDILEKPTGPPPGPPPPGTPSTGRKPRRKKKARPPVAKKRVSKAPARKKAKTGRRPRVAGKKVGPRSRKKGRLPPK